MDKLLNKYAELVVRTGVNLQPQQLLVINSPIECSDFARGWQRLPLRPELKM